MFRGSETQLNPLSPHDALKHHITSLKTKLFCLQPSRELRQQFAACSG